MIPAGFVFDNPLTHARYTVLQGEVETQGKGFSLEVRRAPQAASDQLAHYHPTWIESFEIVSGIAHCAINGVIHRAAAGETLVVSPNQVHIHPWNNEATEMVYRQTSTFGQPDVEGVRVIIGLFTTLAGLARDGKLDQRGRPKNALQLAVMLKAYNKYGTYDALLPAWLQTVLGQTVGSLGEALGYRTSYPEYLHHQAI
jgi:hypothetical protein